MSSIRKFKKGIKKINDEKLVHYLMLDVKMLKKCLRLEKLLKNKKR